MARCGPDLELELESEAPAPIALGSAEAEASSFLRLVGHGGEDLASIRAAIAIPASVERELQAFADLHPEESAWVEQSLAYRRAVLEEFDRLAGVPAPADSFPDSVDPTPEELPTARDLEASAAFQEELASAMRFLRG